MIVRVDHIAISALDLMADGKALRPLGYEPVFIEPDLPNPSIKRALMGEYGGRHGLALLSAGAGIDVELLDHGHRREADPYLAPIVGGGVPGVVPTEARLVVDGRSLVGGSLEALELPVWVDEAEGGITEIVVRAADPEASCAFWGCVGFRGERERDGVRTVVLTPPIGSTECRLHVVQGAASELPRLDDAGANCIALVTTSIEGDLDAVARAGYTRTDVERLAVNGRDLLVGFAIGPCGELVELVGVDRR